MSDISYIDVAKKVAEHYSSSSPKNIKEDDISFVFSLKFIPAKKEGWFFHATLSICKKNIFTEDEAYEEMIRMIEFDR